eukprot:PhF_6_TR8758/c0_g1_i2/m.13813
MSQGSALMARKFERLSGGTQTQSQQQTIPIRTITEQYVTRDAPLVVPDNSDEPPALSYFEQQTIQRPKAPKHHKPGEGHVAPGSAGSQEPKSLSPRSMEGAPEIAQRVLEALYDNKLSEQERNQRVQEHREISRCRMMKRMQDRTRLESLVRGTSSTLKSTGGGTSMSNATDASRQLHAMMRGAEETYLAVNAERHRILTEHRELCIASLRRRHHSREHVERSLHTHYSRIKDKIRQAAGLIEEEDDVPEEAPMEVSLCPNKSVVFRAMRMKHEAKYLQQEEDRDIARAMDELTMREERQHTTQKQMRTEVAANLKKGEKPKKERKRDVPYDIGIDYHSPRTPSQQK